MKARRPGRVERLGAWFATLGRGLFARVRAAGVGMRGGRAVRAEDVQAMPGSAADPERWRRAQGVFLELLDLPSAERHGLLAQIAGDDVALREDVASLLGAHDAPAGPLDRLGTELMAPLLAPLRSPPSGQAHASPESPMLPGYEVIERIANGGMGVVYRGRDLRLQRDVALKFLPPAPGAHEARRRFLLEARSAAALEHPNICTIHEIGETAAGGLYIAMPLYDGETLDRRVARGAVEWEEVVDIGVQLASGLARAHEAGIIHRDIKPANVCMTTQGVVKILDFGIAKVAATALTSSSMIVGTAAYMSPEQARGQEVDHRSDLWSLGVVLYEMLAGQQLFHAEGYHAVLAAIRSAEPVPIGRLRGAAPAALIRVLARLLERDPAARPSSASAVASLLRGVAVAAPGDDAEAESVAALAPDGERRQATILVAAVAGYQALLDRLEPAALAARLERLRDAAENVVRAHGGILNEFSGDCLVALFGVPVTHEDDAQRAARAARALHDITSAEGVESVALRTGIATGTVVARPSGNAERACTLAGDPPRTAARLAARAEPGATLVDESTARAAHPRFELTASEPLPSDDGSDGHVPVHALGAPRPGPTGPSHVQPFRLTAYTGRRRELDTLVACYERAVAGEGQAVTVFGEAGAGKSRLVHEFRERIEGAPGRVIHGHCESYAGRPYGPFVEIMLEILGLDRDEQASGEAGVVDAVRTVHPHLEDFIPFYLHLLSIPTERFLVPRQLRGEQFRASMREALAALITLASETAPLILILEDWHWADDASSEVLKQLAEVTHAYPVLTVVCCRTGYATVWDGVQARTSIHLAPLGIADSVAMLAAMLGVRDIPPELAAAIHDRAGGNPFFLEELCQSLREAGMLRVDGGSAALSGSPETLHLPTTIHGVIRTRLDRLPSATREVVRAAAVLGRDFTFGLLQHLGHERYALDRALETLKRLGILQQSRVAPERAFRFKHVLTQEVAYDTLLQHRRRVLHRQAGVALEEHFSYRTEEHASRLAYHFSRAEEWAKAVRYGHVSAARARSLNEFQDALATLEDVLAWLSRLPDDLERRDLQVDTLLQQEELCETLGQRGRQQEILDRLGGLVDARSDPRRLIEVYRRRGDVYTLLRRFDEARSALEAALDLARTIDDAAAQGHVLRSLGLTGWHAGDADRALADIEEALRLDRDRGDEDAVIADLTNKTQILKDMGRYRDALACLEQASDLLEARPSDLKMSYVLHHMANIHRILGDDERALRYLEAAKDLAGNRHLPIQRSFHLTAIAHIHLNQGRLDEAIRTYEEAVVVARRARYAEGLAQSLRPLGELLAGVGRERQALPYLREAAELFAQLGNPDRESAVWRKTAETAERTGAAEEAAYAWSRAHELAASLGDRDTELDALEGAARLARLVGDRDGAEQNLAAALAIARDIGPKSREASLLNSLAILDWEQGAFAPAAACYEAALAIFRDLGDDAHQALILNSLGATLKAMGQREASRTRLEDGLRAARRSGQRLLEGHALAGLGELSLEAGELDDALARFQASLDIRRAIADRTGEAWMHHYIGCIHARRGQETHARTHNEAARAIAAELADPRLLQACDAAPA
jgi:class 3 adenylate cyclase/tetratricopeptide (TPR) repeat protein